MVAEAELLARFTQPAEQHEFDCPVEGCGGKLALDSELCRWSHGANVTCRPSEPGRNGKAHRSKWCCVSYSFVPAELWGEHLSCCNGSAASPSTAACVDVADLLPRLANTGGDGEEAVAEEGGKGDVSSVVLVGSHEPAELRKRQIAEGIDETVLDAVARSLKRNRKHITAGDPEHTQWWDTKLRDMQRESVISSLQARADFPKIFTPGGRWGKVVGDGGKDERDAETQERAREGAFFYAVSAGDVKAVQKFVREWGQAEKDVDDLVDGNQNSPLHWAAASGSADTCRALMDFGLNVSARGEHGHTPLHLAAMHGKHSIVELLMARGANADEPNSAGITPRHLFNLFYQTHAGKAAPGL